MIKFEFEEGASLGVFEKFLSEEMGKTVNFLKNEIAKIRSGRASTAMIEDVKVDVYGTTSPLKNLAALSAPEVDLLVIQPWDKSNVDEIGRALALSELDVNPVTAGSVIRIKLPRLSSERREDLVKSLHRKLEDAKVSVRGIRRDVHNLIRDFEKDKKVSEDYSKRVQEFLQKFTDKVMESLEEIIRVKEKEIRST